MDCTVRPIQMKKTGMETNKLEDAHSRPIQHFRLFVNEPDSVQSQRQGHDIGNKDKDDIFERESKIENACLRRSLIVWQRRP